MPGRKRQVILPWPSRSPPRGEAGPSRLAIPDWCLFLDVDGTLLEFAPLPNALNVPAGLKLRIQALQQALNGALALISGRTLQSLDSLFAPLHLPAAAAFGTERRDASGQMHASLQGEGRSATSDKATAIEAFLAEWPFAGRTPIFVGDDASDADGFEVVKSHGGMTIAVGEELAADRQLVNPRAVNHWLSNFLATGEP